MDFNENIPDSRLLLRYLYGTAVRNEQQIVDAWRRADDANEKDFLHLALLYDVKRTQKGLQRWNTKRAYSRVRKQLVLSATKRIALRVAVAASLIIGVVSAFYLLRDEQESTSIVTVQTNAGTRSSVVLPDGSKVCLNAGTTLTYPAKYGADCRWVTLVGEGWFEVAHDTKKTFQVKTANDEVKINVIGTKFNLCAYKDHKNVQATLVEGSISFSAKGMKTQIMSAGQELTYNLADGSHYLKTVNTDMNTAWKDNRLKFRDTPMPNVLEQLSNFFTVDFDIRDTVINSYTFTGEFVNQPLFLILDYIKSSSNISFETSYRNVNGVQRPIIILKKI